MVGLSNEGWDRLGRLHALCRVVVMSRFVRGVRSGWWVRVSPRADLGFEPAHDLNVARICARYGQPATNFVWKQPKSWTVNWPSWLQSA